MRNTKSNKKKKRDYIFNSMQCAIIEEMFEAWVGSDKRTKTKYLEAFVRDCEELCVAKNLRKWNRPVRSTTRPVTSDLINQKPNATQPEVQPPSETS